MQKYNLINIKTNKIICTAIKPDIEKILEYTSADELQNYRIEAIK